jgi:hypothetical protein
VAGRASASARVSPPAPLAPDGARGGPPFNEFTTDVAGRGKGPSGPSGPAGQFSEHTTDISGRGRSDQPYVPAPALPTLPPASPLVDGFPPGRDQTDDGDRPRMGGVFPGPATRATVTPPSPDDTTSWPSGPESEADDQGRFDQFKAEVLDSGPVAKPETPHVRMLPVLLGVIVGAALLVGLAFGLVYLISGDSDSTFTVNAGECVKRNGDEAVKANCGDAGAFEVVSIADTKEQCADPGQPYVLNPTSDGRTQVLCLKPRS